MSKNQHVYFVLSESGRIKIGFTSNVRIRLSALRVSSAEPLEVLGVCEGGTDTERAIHDRFNGLNLRGEWFRSSPEIIEWIKENSSPYDPHVHSPKKRVSAELEAKSAALKAMVTPLLEGESVPLRIKRAALVAGISPAVARAIWYCSGNPRVDIGSAVTPPVLPRPNDNDISRLILDLSGKVESLSRAVFDIRRMLTSSNRASLLFDLSNNFHNEGGALNG